MQKISTLEVATKKPMESVILTLPPGNDFIFQTIASRSGAYAAEPIEVLIFGFVASEGTGTSISTFVAVLEMKKKNTIIFQNVASVTGANQKKMQTDLLSLN
jgi:hypothetical protein